MKTLFITGAASGIGLATAKRFAAQGWFIGLYDVNTQALDTLLASEDFPHACGQYCDVTDRQSVEDALAHFSEQTDGRLDVLVNNAGLLISDKFEDIDYRIHDKLIEVNVKGLTNVAQAAFPLLKQTPDSCMVNLCSVSSVHGIPRLAVYSASKFYVDGLTEALHLEWKQHGIRVTSVKPPAVKTAMGHQLNDLLLQKLAMNMEPETVAQAVQVAVEGKRTSYLLGTSSKVWGLLDKYLPDAGRHWLAAYLTGH